METTVPESQIQQDLSPAYQDDLIVSAICSDINDIYSVDSVTETVTVIRQAGKALGLNEKLRERYNYYDAVQAYVRNNVFQKDQENLLKNMHLDNICNALRKEENISIFYRVFRNGELQYFRLKCIRVGSGDGFRQIVYAFMPENDRSGLSPMLRSLELDDVTGVYNKQAFYHHAAQILDENPDKEYDLIVTDIDNFKLVNRIYGRNGGDEILKYLAGRYEMAARNGICARYGADQFAILSVAMTDQEVELFHFLAEKLRTEAPNPYLTLRYGINRKVDRKDSIAEMCDKAMLALRSKGNRDSLITVYDQAVVQNHYRAQMYTSDFERAITNNEFVVWAQPKFNSFNGRMTSAEALVRWKTAEGTFVSPGAFIPVFEAEGQIVQLDEYVFRYVCRRQKELLDAGKDPIPVSVNLSRATLFHPGTVEKYSAIVEEYGIPKTLVPVELTESATVENVTINRLVKQIKDAGFILHLDDFGSGYSSLSSLGSLPMDVLKLDKSLVDGIGNTGGDEILRHIIELAHFFQMEVVAEGVENNDQYNFLKKLSCDTIQGYLFSRPVPFDEYLKLREMQPAEKTEMMDGTALAEEASVGSLRITNDAKMMYLSALARIYMTMHVIDLKEDTVVEFATTTNVKEHVNRAHNCVAQMKAAMTATVSPEYLDAVLEFTDLTTIVPRLKGKKTISAEFVGKHFGWFRARFVTVTTNENDDPEKIIYTTQVIEADKRKEELMLRACRTDELTGVYNRSAFDEDIKTLELSSDLAVMTVDINGLKKTNDRFGHSAGDELIWGAADCLNTVLGKGSLLYRTGGDRFTAIFYASPERVQQIRNDYENAERNWIGNEIRSLSTSCGIVSHAEFPKLSIQELAEKADLRRLESKAGQDRN